MKVTTAELASSVASKVNVRKVHAEGTSIVVKCGKDDIKIRICYNHRKAEYFVEVDSNFQLLSQVLSEVVIAVAQLNQR